MKAVLLLALRATTGALLIVWGAMKVFEPAHAIVISDKFYSKTLSAEALQAPLGIAEMVLGGLVVLGLLRRIVYPLQAIVLCVAALSIWKYLLDPLGLWLLTHETRNYLFFPSSTVAVATLVLLAFKEHDRLSLDCVLFRRRSSISG